MVDIFSTGTINPKQRNIQKHVYRYATTWRKLPRGGISRGGRLFWEHWPAVHVQIHFLVMDDYVRLNKPNT